MNFLFLLFFFFTVYYEVKQSLFICWLSKRKKHRSSHLQMFYKAGVVKNFAKFKGKDLCQSLVFNKCF